MIKKLLKFLPAVGILFGVLVTGGGIVRYLQDLPSATVIASGFLLVFLCSLVLVGLTCKEKE